MIETKTPEDLSAITDELLARAHDRTGKLGRVTTEELALLSEHHEQMLVDYVLAGELTVSEATQKLYSKMQEYLHSWYGHKKAKQKIFETRQLLTILGGDLV